MKSYTKVYFKYFNYGEQDFVPCEVCGAKAVDIHHIEARSKRKDLLNEITNLMALCRHHHEKYGDKVKYKEFLQETHLKFMENAT